MEKAFYFGSLDCCGSLYGVSPGVQVQSLFCFLTKKEKEVDQKSIAAALISQPTEAWLAFLQQEEAISFSFNRFFYNRNNRLMLI